MKAFLAFLQNRFAAVRAGRAQWHVHLGLKGYVMRRRGPDGGWQYRPLTAAEEQERREGDAW